MSTYAIKMNGADGSTYLPVTSTSLIQHKYGDTAYALSSYLGGVGEFTKLNALTVEIELNSSGNPEITNVTAEELVTAFLGNRTIIGVHDITTLPNNTHYQDPQGNQNLNNSVNDKTASFLLCHCSSTTPMVFQGQPSVTFYYFKFVDFYTKYNITVSLSNGVYTFSGSSAEFGEKYASIEHDHDSEYNKARLTGDMANSNSAVCKTAADTAAKTVTILGWTNIQHGDIVQVRFKNGNTATQPTLNISSTGAYKIRYSVGYLTDTTLIKAGDCVTFIYCDSGGTPCYFILAIDHSSERTKTTNSNTTQLYLTGTATAGVNSLSYDSGVYLTSTAGELRATSFNENGTTLASKYAQISTLNSYAKLSDLSSYITQTSLSSNSYVTQTSLSSNSYALAADTLIDVFEVIFTVNGTSITANKTYNEILAAWNAKKLVIGKIVSANSNNTDWYSQIGDEFSPNLLTCNYADFKGDPVFTFTCIYEKPNGSAFVTTVFVTSNHIEATYNELSTSAHTHSNYAPLASPTFTGTPKAPTATAGTNNTQIATTAFVNTAIANGLKYTVKNASSNAVTFTTSTKMLPNTVYVVGSVSNSALTWQKLNTLTINNSSLDGDTGIVWNNQIPNTSLAIGGLITGKTVATYQILWVAGSSGTSITLPASVKWKSGIAPDSRDMVNKLCELTIMNGLATINIS